MARVPGFASVELPMHGWFLPALGLALLGGAGAAVAAQRFGQRWGAALIAIVFVDVLIVNQLLNPLAYSRESFESLYGRVLQAFDTQVAAADPPVERLYGPPLAAVATATTRCRAGCRRHMATTRSSWRPTRRTPRRRQPPIFA